MITSRLTICFLGGAGGNFISNMLFNLQYPPVMADLYSHTDKHYHRAMRSWDITLTHHPVDNCKYYTGNFKFNIYLNGIYKYNILDHDSNKLPKIAQINKYKQAANFSLKFFADNIDINYDDIYLDNTKFVNDCFDVFDYANIQYKKDYTIANKCLQKFKKTCVDPDIDYMNWDSFIWLGWCLGIDNHLQNTCPLFSTVDQIQEYLYSRRSLYDDITKKYNMVFFNI